MKMHKKIANIFGYDLYKKKKSHLTLELHLQKLFTSLNINCVIDVGANSGQFGAALRNSGYSGRIVSFEPVAGIFDKLNEQAKRDNAWHTYKLALGAEGEHKKINVVSSSVLSSFHAPSEYAKSSFSDEVVDVVNRENVEVKQLDDIFDDLISDLHNPRIFLKLDTQGHDLEVLRGATKSIGKILALQTEMSVIPLYEEMPDYVQSLTELRALDFEVTGIYPIIRDSKDLILIEFDCIMRNKNASLL